MSLALHDLLHECTTVTTVEANLEQQGSLLLSILLIPRSRRSVATDTSSVCSALLDTVLRCALQLYPTGQHGAIPQFWNRHHDKKLLAYAYATGVPMIQHNKLVCAEAASHSTLSAHPESAACLGGGCSTA